MGMERHIPGLDGEPRHEAIYVCLGQEAGLRLCDPLDGVSKEGPGSSNLPLPVVGAHAIEVPLHHISAQEGKKGGGGGGHCVLLVLPHSHRHGHRRGHISSHAQPQPQKRKQTQNRPTKAERHRHTSSSAQPHTHPQPQQHTHSHTHTHAYRHTNAYRHRETDKDRQIGTTTPKKTYKNANTDLWCVCCSSYRLFR